MFLFELTADEQQQYDANKTIVDAEFERLVSEEQERRLNESGSLAFTVEDQKALFVQALNSRPSKKTNK